MPKKKNILKMLKVRDPSDGDYVRPFNDDRIPALPCRALVVGRSQLSGKSSLVFNYMAREELFKDFFDPLDIYIVSPSIESDPKLSLLIDYLDIPRSNCIDAYDEFLIGSIYKQIKENFMEAKREGRGPIHSCIILDDCSFSGNLKGKRNGVIPQMFQNSRHYCVSLFVTAQHYSDIPTAVRNNCTAFFCFQLNNRQTDAIIEDHSFIDPKIFKKKMREVTAEKHSFMYISYDNALPKRYLDSDFNFVDMTGDPIL